MSTEFHLGAGAAAAGPYALDIDPKRAGWDHSSLRVLDLPPGAHHAFATGDSEWIVLPLSGGCTVLTDEGETFELTGRESVFSGVTDFAYVPRDAHVQIATAAAWPLRAHRRPLREPPARPLRGRVRRPRGAARHRQLLPPGQQLRRGGHLRL